MGHESDKKLLKKDCKVRYKKIWSTLLFLSVIFSSGLQPSANLAAVVDVVHQLKKAIDYSPAGCDLGKGTFTASVSSVANAYLNNYKYSCNEPLTLISVGVTSANASCFLKFNFSKELQSIQNAITGSGIYVGVQCSIQNSQNVVTAVIMDNLGNIKLQKSHILKSDVGGLSQFSVGFNTKNYVTVNGITSISANPLASLAVNNVPLTGSVAYQQVATGSGGSNQPSPSGSVNLTPPQPPITPATAAPTFSPVGCSCSRKVFNPVNALQGAQYGDSVTCLGDLQSLNVGLTDENAICFYSFEFDFANDSILNQSQNQTILQQLMNQGMYIAINMLQNPAGLPTGNYAQVCLTDQAGAIFVQSTSPAALPAGCGFKWANIGFNMGDTLQSPTPTQTYINWLPIHSGQRVCYQYDSLSGTAPLNGQGGQTVPALLHPPTPPLVPAAPPVVGVCMAPFIPTPPHNNTSPVINGTPISCAPTAPATVGLQSINVNLTDATGNSYYSFTFDQTVFNRHVIQLLAQQGLYIAINFITNSATGTYAPGTNAAGNFAQVCLTDDEGNVYAWSTSGPLSAGTGFVWANIGFNMSNTLVGTPAENQTYYNWIPVNKPGRIWYQQGPAKSATSPVPTGPAGTQVLPVYTPPQLTPPTPILTPSQGFQIGNCQAPFTPVQNMKYKNKPSGLANVAPIPNAVNATAISCAGGLQSLNVGLTDANGTSFYSVTFDQASIFSNPKIQQLCQQGMYIMVKMLQNLSSSSLAPGTSGMGNFAQVCLMDSQGNVYAWSTTPPLGAGQGFVFANIGFNMSDTLVAPTGNQTYINWAPIAAAKPIFYQNNGSTTPPSSGHGSQATPPAVTTIPLNVPATTGKPATQQVITVTPLELSQESIAYYNAAANPCTPTPGTFPNVSSSISSTFGGTTYSTKSGKLDNLQVGVTDANAQCFLVFAFGSDIIGEEQMQALIQQGMYVGVVCAPASSGNTVTVQLTDASGTVYASGTYSSAAGALSQYYVGFDTNISELMSPVQAGQFVSAANAAKLQANAIRKFAQKVPLTQTVYYKQLPASSAS